MEQLNFIRGLVKADLDSVLHRVDLAKGMTHPQQFSDLVEQIVVHFRSALKTIRKQNEFEILLYQEFAGDLDKIHNSLKDLLVELSARSKSIQSPSVLGKLTNAAGKIVSLLQENLSIHTKVTNVASKIKFISGRIPTTIEHMWESYSVLCREFGASPIDPGLFQKFADIQLGNSTSIYRLRDISVHLPGRQTLSVNPAVLFPNLPPELLQEFKPESNLKSEQPAIPDRFLRVKRRIAHKQPILDFHGNA